MKGRDEPEETLEAPSIPDAFDGKLDPWALGESITYLVPFYPEHMKVGDIISASVIGMPPFDKETWLDERTLTEVDLHDPIVFACPARTLQPIDGGKALFNYTVRRGGVVEHRSRALILEILRDAPRAPQEPLVVRAVGGVLRMEDLARGDVDVRVEQHTGNAGDSIELLWMPASGPVYRSPPQVLASDGQILTFAVPYDTANASPGDVAVQYELTRPGNPAIPSRTTRVDVIAYNAPLPLPAPIVVQAGPDGRLDPLAVNELTVRIPREAPIEPGDGLTLTWMGSTREGSREVVVSAPSSDMVIPVEMAVLAYNLGEPVQVRYDLYNEQGARTSERTNIEVDPIPDDSSRLPKPTFSQASGDELDMGSFVGDAQVIIERYRLAADGQRYWLTLSGKRDDGSSKEVSIADAKPIIGSGEATIELGEVTRAELMQFKDESAIELALKITFNHSNDEGGSVRFPLMLFTLHHSKSTTFPPPTVDGTAADSTLDPVDVTAFRVRLPESAAFRPGDIVTISWFPIDGSGTFYTTVDATPGAAIDIPRSHCGLALGRKVLVQYTVTRGTERYFSGSNEILVKPYGRPPSTLFPDYEELDGEYLDLGSFPGDAHPFIAPYYLLTMGQRYWMGLSGVGHDGSPLSFGVEENGAIPGVVDGHTVALSPVPRAYLQQFRTESTMILTLLISFDQSQDPSTAVVFERAVRIRQA
jgi:hypothetical protein